MTNRLAMLFIANRMKPQKRKSQNGTRRPQTSQRIRLLVCDDQKLIRTRVREMLKKVSSFEIVGEAADGQSAVTMALDLKPDVVLMDVSMPNLDGIEATRRILAKAPDIRILAFSVDSTAETLGKLVHAGAHGFLFKTGDAEELISALQRVAAGGYFFSRPSGNSGDRPRRD